jgi:hypothetical protein
MDTPSVWVSVGGGHEAGLGVDVRRRGRQREGLEHRAVAGIHAHEQRVIRRVRADPQLAGRREGQVERLHALRLEQARTVEARAEDRPTRRELEERAERRPGLAGEDLRRAVLAEDEVGRVVPELGCRQELAIGAEAQQLRLARAVVPHPDLAGAVEAGRTHGREDARPDRRGAEQLEPAVEAQHGLAVAVDEDDHLVADLGPGGRRQGQHEHQPTPPSGLHRGSSGVWSRRGL